MLRYHKPMLGEDGCSDLGHSRESAFDRCPLRLLGERDGIRPVRMPTRGRHWGRMRRYFIKGSATYTWNPNTERDFFQSENKCMATKSVLCQIRKQSGKQFMQCRHIKTRLTT